MIIITFFISNYLLLLINLLYVENILVFTQTFVIHTFFLGFKQKQITCPFCKTAPFGGNTVFALGCACCQICGLCHPLFCSGPEPILSHLLSHMPGGNCMRKQSWLGHGYIIIRLSLARVLFNGTSCGDSTLKM